jgi:hypothetical protein
MTTIAALREKVAEIQTMLDHPVLGLGEDERLEAKAAVRSLLEWLLLDAPGGSPAA